VAWLFVSKASFLVAKGLQLRVAKLTKYKIETGRVSLKACSSKRGWGWFSYKWSNKRIRCVLASNKQFVSSICHLYKVVLVCKSSSSCF
jgi:hypothetical protein